MFGKRLADERRRLGLSQDDFAQAIDLGRSGYAAIEAERAQLDVPRLVKLGERVGVDVMYVLFGEPMALAAGKRIDWDLVEGIWMGINSWAADHDLTVPKEKQMVLLKLLYLQLAVAGELDSESLEDALRLVA